MPAFGILIIVIAGLFFGCTNAARYSGIFINLSRFRGGEKSEQKQKQLPDDELLKTMLMEHTDECSKSPYWQCSTEESDTETESNDEKIVAPPNVSFKNYAMEEVVPDFDEIFDHNSLIYVSETPIFTREECNEVVTAAETHFNGNWTKLPSGRFKIDGFWIKDVPAVKEWFDRQLKLKLFPTLVRLFPDFVDSVSKLCVESAYVFKYNPTTGGKSDIHTDSGCLSFTISLNPNTEYKGGGTWFETLGENGTIIEMGEGHVTFRPGGVRHQGNAITEGVRYIIGGFLMHKNRVENVRRLLNKGTKEALQANLDQAEKYLRYAVNLNENFCGSRVTYADTLKRNGKIGESAEQLEKAIQLNHRNIEALYSLGIIRKNQGNLEEAARLFEGVLEVEADDLDSMNARGEVAGLANDFESEAFWYEKLLSHDPFLQHTLAAAASCNLGVALGELGRDLESEAMLRQALDIDPMQFSAAYSLASSYANSGRLVEAIELYRHTLTLDVPDSLKGADDKALIRLYKCAVMYLQQQNEEQTLSLNQEQAQEKLREIMGDQNLNAIIFKSKMSK